MTPLPWLWALLAFPAPARAQGRPNVVVFMADTLRADALGCYGQREFKTPRLDAFAAEGTLFANAFAQSSWTRDSVAGLFTGEYHWVHGVTHRFSSLGPEPKTLAGLLAQRGYRTGAVNANPNLDKAFGMDRGFADFLPLYGWQVDPSRPVDPSELKAPAQKTVDASLEWIKKNRGGPFFLFILATDPHNPYAPPAPYDALYDPGYRPSHPPQAYGGAHPSAKEIAHQRALYGGAVTYLDSQFGRLLDGLAAMGLKEDTAVVFVSDHGEEFYEHGRPFHGRTLYDAAIHVPLIVRHPGKARAGARVPALVELRDLFPTILHWAGKDLPRFSSPSQPMDLGWCLSGDCPGRWGVVSLLELDGASVAAVRSRSRKILSSGSPAKTQVYDLGADPGETADLGRWDAPEDQRLFSLLSLSRDKARSLRPGPEPVQPPIDEGLRRKLKAMGYLE